MVNLNVFSQILSLIDRELSKDLVAKHKRDKHCKGINSRTHLASMLFCHFSSADSVRDISNSLQSTTGNLNHLGVGRAPSKSNISYINKHRSDELFKHSVCMLEITILKTGEITDVQSIGGRNTELNNIAKRAILLNKNKDFGKYKPKWKAAIMYNTGRPIDTKLKMFIKLGEDGSIEVLLPKTMRNFTGN